jgi:predicted nuclease of predicted toxin-antitoxin system
VKFLIDNALSPRIAEVLRNAGYDAVHVQDYNMSAAKDMAVFERAAFEERIIVSADTDFGTLLAQRKTSKPSVVLLRWPLLRLAEDQAKVILANLPNFASDLETGCIVIIEPSVIRVRLLPIGNE